MADYPNKAVVLLWHTTALMEDTHCISKRAYIAGQIGMYLSLCTLLYLPFSMYLFLCTFYMFLFPRICFYVPFSMYLSLSQREGEQPGPRTGRTSGGILNTQFGAMSMFVKRKIYSGPRTTQVFSQRPNKENHTISAHFHSSCFTETTLMESSPARH